MLKELHLLDAFSLASYNSPPFAPYTQSNSSSLLSLEYSIPLQSSAEHNTMSTGGVVYRDLLPIPDTDPTEHEGTSSTLLNAPTESHALALQAAKATHPAEQGAAQVDHNEEVVDLGWNEPKEHVAKPLVGGLSNEDLWLLVRRFNKVRIHTSCPFRTRTLIIPSKCIMSKRYLLLHLEAWT